MDIHSSLEQVAWGNLEAKQEGNIEAVLLTAEKNIATLKQVYLVQIGQGENAEHYRAEEYFRVKKGTDRLHLIEYERTVSRLIFEEDDLFFGNTLYLGISDGNLQYTESAEGGKVAFVKDGVLYVADPGSNHFARVYSYYDKSDYNERPLTELPRLKIFNIDEEGRTTFAVYGYIPRGLHEGQSGLLVYTFDFAKNTLEEEMFVPYGGSTEVLAANLDTLLYLNGAGKLYFYLDGCIYEANARSAEYEVIAKDLTPDSFCVNGTGTMAAWTQSQAATGVKKITLENFETMRQTTIEAKSGEVILPKAFMKNAFVYGSARAEDVSVDAYGNVLFPMYSVKIQTEDGTVYKNYEMDGIYVTECTVSDNLLTLRTGISVRRIPIPLWTILRTKRKRIPWRRWQRKTTKRFTSLRLRKNIQERNCRSCVRSLHSMKKTESLISEQGTKTVSSMRMPGAGLRAFMPILPMR